MTDSRSGRVSDHTKVRVRNNLSKFHMNPTDSKRGTLPIGGLKNETDLINGQSVGSTMTSSEDVRNNLRVKPDVGDSRLCSCPVEDGTFLMVDYSELEPGDRETTEEECGSERMMRPKFFFKIGDPGKSNPEVLKRRIRGNLEKGQNRFNDGEPMYKADAGRKCCTRLSDTHKELLVSKSTCVDVNI